MQLDRVDIVARGANHDLESNEGAHILLMKRAPDPEPITIASDTIVPFSRETIAELIDSEVQKITSQFTEKESNMKFAEELNAWENRSYEDEGRIVAAIITKAQRITKSEGAQRAPHEVIEAELFAHASTIMQRDRISKGAALEVACRERPVLRAAANEARHHLHSLLANE